MFKLTTFAAALVASLAEGRERAPEFTGYFIGDEYQSASAQSKLNDLWTMCQADQTVADDPPYEYLDDFFQQRMAVTTCRRADEMKPSHKKLLHAQGVVGLVTWENVGNHTFTGLYSTDTQGLLRFSESNFAVKEQNGLSPSLAIKFLRDGMESVNMFGAPGFEPMGSWNFFDNMFQSHVDVHENEENFDTITQKFAE